MPEGDTVWRTARSLDRALSGREVEADFRVPALATTRIRAEILCTQARGKHLLTYFASGELLHTHLKMEGAWHLYRPGERWHRPTHQARVVLTSAERVAVGFSLGVVELVDSAQDAVGHLGPDLLGPDWDADEALRRLLAQPQREVGEAILDQRNLAGIGNMYRSEVCFVCGLDPHTPVGDVPDLARLVRRAKGILEANKDRVEQTTTGDTRRGRDRWVYLREGEPCRRCGTRVLMRPQGPPGQERGVYWCPSCQPAPTAAAAQAAPTEG